jgi:hypothetical protein
VSQRCEDLADVGRNRKKKITIHLIVEEISATTNAPEKNTRNSGVSVIKDFSRT